MEISDLHKFRLIVGVLYIPVTVEVKEDVLISEAPGKELAKLHQQGLGDDDSLAFRWCYFQAILHFFPLCDDLVLVLDWTKLFCSLSC